MPNSFSPLEALLSLCDQLRTPLTKLRGYVDLLENELISEDQRRTLLRQVSEIVEELQNLRATTLRNVNEGTKGDAHLLEAIEEPKIRYTQQEDESGIFDFPLEALLEQLERSVKEHSDAPEDVALLEWLSSQTTQIIEVSHKQWQHMAFFAAELIERGFFTVFCPKCEQHLSASSISINEWTCGQGFLAAGGGRRFLCNQGHELLKVEDWIS